MTYEYDTPWLILVKKKISASKKRTYRRIRLEHRRDCDVHKRQKAGTVVQPYSQWEYHKQNIQVEDNQKKISEKIKNFCKEVPTAEEQMVNMLVLQLKKQNISTPTTTIWAHHNTPIFGDKSCMVRMNPYVLQKPITDTGRVKMSYLSIQHQT